MRFQFILWFLLLSLLSIQSYIDQSFAFGQCLEDQKTLLLHLKKNLGSSNLSSWNSTTDCCFSWDGIKCDKNGHVISLDLNNKSISSASFDTSWSSLFNLKYLISLNLSYNIFNSSIPSGLDKLVNLTHLNLSNSGFAGQIPIEISQMKRLVSLDLSTLFPLVKPLKLENPDLKTLVKDLFKLRELYLDGVNISMNGLEWSKALSSAVPNLQVLSLSNCALSGPFDSSLSKLSSLSILRLDQNNISDQVPEFFGDFINLSVLHLSSCNLSGTFPEKIFQLPLQSLKLSTNLHLQGSLPEFPQNGPLENLVLSGTKFSGTLPESIGNLRFLSYLELQNCSFNGSIPTSMSNLTQLQYLDFSFNNFTGLVPHFNFSENLTQINLAYNRLTGQISLSQWGRHLKLRTLNLKNNLLNGTIPASLFTCPFLQRLDLSQNRFTGPLSMFSDASSLILDTLDFSYNMLEESIPLSLFDVKSLKILTLSFNKLNGTLQLDRFQNLKNLSSLDLSGNNISINSTGASSALFPQVGTLKLSSCNLKTFPEFLRNQSTLRYLDLSNNRIRGEIPHWILEIGNRSLTHLNLSRNLLENPNQIFFDARPSKSLVVVDMHSNLLQGPIPILPESAIVLDYSNNNIASIPVDIGSYLTYAIFFSLSHNSISGKIPFSICNGKNLQVLDLSNNSLGDSIPPCLAEMSYLRVLNLRSNKLTGSMPETFPDLCSLRTLDFNDNKLEGKLSETLSNCSMLEVLDLGNNHMNGPFPCWLGEMFHLRVLVLRENNFSGTIPSPRRSNNPFSVLQIIDISSNNFVGNLPSEQFLRWKGMMIDEEAESKFIRFKFLPLSQLYYQDSVTVTSKGQQMEYVKILTIFTSIDMSNNKFEGQIPEGVGNLISLHVLNFSGNALTGSIPSSLGNLKHLESLDLSNNMLSGSIPPQLADLTFLSVLNLSFNQLVGAIPIGPQFQTFNKNVYEGNIGLCGPPLSRNCRDTTKLAPSPLKSQNKSSQSEVDWRFILTGLGFGAGAAFVVAPLWFWTEGRKWYDEQIERLLRMMFPSTAFRYNDGRVDSSTEDNLEEEYTEDEELTENTSNYSDVKENMEGSRPVHDRYCLFCTKVDVRTKRVIHNPKCNCHGSPYNSSSIP